MHSKTSNIYKKLNDIGLEKGPLSERCDRISEDRNALLKDAYKDEVAYVLTCGPSLNAVWNDALEDFLSDKLVISVKQALNKAPFSDFHLYNEVRMDKYSYPMPTIRLGVSQFQHDHAPHIHYPIFSYKYEEALFCTNDYERWLLDQSIVRPWGIGIMFELGLHLPIHLGCKKIVIIGFDMNDTGAFHFYDDEKQKDSDFYKVDTEEFGYARASSEVYYQWCKGKDVDVFLYSPLSRLKMPQITFSDIKNL